MQAKKLAAFTLIELLIVVAIIGLLAGISAGVYPMYIRRAKLTKTQTKISALESAIETYKLHIGRYPRQGRLYSELTQSSGVRWQGPYIKIDQEDRNSLAPAPGMSNADFANNIAAMAIINPQGQRTASSPHSGSPGSDESGYLVGEPGFADGFGRRMLYIPHNVYSDDGNGTCNSSGAWDSFFCIPVNPIPDPHAETGFGESGFYNPNTFQLFSAGSDGEVLVDSDDRIIPLFWSNGLNDDGGQGLLGSELQDDNSPDDFFSWNTVFLEDDAAN